MPTNNRIQLTSGLKLAFYYDSETVDDLIAVLEGTDAPYFVRKMDGYWSFDDHESLLAVLRDTDVDVTRSDIYFFSQKFFNSTEKLEMNQRGDVVYFEFRDGTPVASINNKVFEFERTHLGWHFARSNEVIEKLDYPSDRPFPRIDLRLAALEFAQLIFDPKKVKSVSQPADELEVWKGYYWMPIEVPVGEDDEIKLPAVAVLRGEEVLKAEFTTPSGKKRDCRDVLTAKNIRDGYWHMERII